jgi:hypothetical protein
MKKVKDNTIPRSNSALLASGLNAVAGATQFGIAVGLKQNTQADIQTDLDAFVAARDASVVGKAVLRTRRTVVNSVATSGRNFLMEARDTLKRRFGRRHSPAWEVAGFVRSLVVSRSPVKIQESLQLMQTYLAANPDAQNDGLDVTAARAGGLFTNLQAARASASTQKVDTGNLLQARNTAARELGQRLSGLLAELNQLLGPLDERWLGFGFKKPGAKATPEAPQGVTAVLIGPTAASIKWQAALRAEHYRVWKKVAGVDTEFVAVGSPADLDFTLESLPAQATIGIAISAVNNGGESALSGVITLVTN